MFVELYMKIYPCIFPLCHNHAKALKQHNLRQIYIMNDFLKKFYRVFTKLTNLLNLKNELLISQKGLNRIAKRNKGMALKNVDSLTIKNC